MGNKEKGSRDQVKGDVLLIGGFWECDCQDDFVHRGDGACSSCGLSRGECAEARVSDVVDYLSVKKVNKELEIFKLENELINKRSELSLLEGTLSRAEALDKKGSAV